MVGLYYGSLTRIFSSLHPCLFQLSLLAHVLELKLKLPLPFIIHERRASTASDPIFACCLDPHRGENGTDYCAKYEVSHRCLCRAPFYSEMWNHQKYLLRVT